jgi:hypothetical protein
MPVNATHSEYTKALPSWELGEDAVKGSSAIKDKGKKYLPKPNATDKSTENDTRYSQYKERAVFVNFTGQTEEGFMGMVERKDHTIDMSGELEQFADNVDGCGLTLEQSIAGSIRGLLRTGRDGLLVDIAPNVTGETNRRATANTMPMIKRYKSQHIINWREQVINGKKALVLVVLKESAEEIAADGFDSNPKDQYRVLRLTEGVYSQELYNEALEPIPDSYVEPTNASGGKLSYIPFQFIGAEENDTAIDKAILIDIANVNVAHYRNSADFEESSFMVGQPTPVFSGLTQTWIDDVWKGAVQLGSRAGIPLPVDADAKLLQADPNQMPLEGMEKKEEQMVKLGAMIIQDSNGNETAEAAKIRFSGQNSKLGRVIKNTQEAYINAIDWAQEFMTSAQEYELQLNTDFYDSSVNPQLIVAEMQQFDRGIIAKSDMRRNARKRGQIANDRTDEDIDMELGEASPLE